METSTPSTRWWRNQCNPEKTIIQDISNKNIAPEEISNSLAEFLEKEREILYLEELNQDEDVDIGSILEEISRLSAKSPLGPYNNDLGDRSIEDIMREAEKIYLESSKSFEQLSQRSKTSQNLTDIFGSDKSDNSTPTPKSLSPLPLDRDRGNKSDSDVEEESGCDAMSEKSEIAVSLKEMDDITKTIVSKFDSDEKYSDDFETTENGDAKELPEISSVPISDNNSSNSINKNELSIKESNAQIAQNNEAFNTFKEEIVKKDEVIKMLITDNQGLKGEVKSLEVQIEGLRRAFEETARNLKSPEINVGLEKALEELKESKEANTALELQLRDTNKSHQTLKNSYEALVASNNGLERRLLDVDNVLSKYKQELQASQQQREKMLESEANINKLLEAERLQVKKLKQQTEKDSKCILDLNRQIKEMERIITRKHPDSVSALIVAAKSEETSPTARRVLEDRIKALEQEALIRDAQNSQVFIDVHDKFSQMKLKYESHIEDLELHVSDLKTQLKRKVDTYDVYTQTIREDHKIPAKDTTNVAMQTDPVKNINVRAAVRKPEREREPKEETHLLATIRGFQADLTNKEKVIVKLQKEVDELRKTNRRLQKEREGSLKNLTGNKEYRSYPEKLSAQVSTTEIKTVETSGLDEELRAVKMERDKMKLQLCRIEEDYQALKTKRLHDLNTLQEAHEREISTYLANITPLREQLDIQQVTITTLQQQLITTKEELAVITVERDHLNNKVTCGIGSLAQTFNGNDDDSEAVSLRKKVSHLELKYEERENRLRAIVHGLAQKSVMNRSCEQCAARQQQLIGYKAELDQLIATLRCLQ